MSIGCRPYSVTFLCQDKCVSNVRCNILMPRQCVCQVCSITLLCRDKCVCMSLHVYLVFKEGMLNYSLCTEIGRMKERKGSRWIQAINNVILLVYQIVLIFCILLNCTLLPHTMDHVFVRVCMWEREGGVVGLFLCFQNKNYYVSSHAWFHAMKANEYPWLQAYTTVSLAMLHFVCLYSFEMIIFVVYV